MEIPRRLWTLLPKSLGQLGLASLILTLTEMQIWPWFLPQSLSGTPDHPKSQALLKALEPLPIRLPITKLRQV